VRTLLDTNVIISAILFGGVPREILVAATRGRIQIVTSPVLLDELEDLLVEKFRFSADAARATRTEIEALADVVEPGDLPDVCRDPDDNEVLGAAATGAAEVIVTGDRDLLELSSFEDIRLLRPAQYARLLRGDER